MLEKPIAFLQLVWTCVTNALPQPLHILTVKLAIDGLTRRHEILVDNDFYIEKKGQQGLHIVANLTLFFRPR